MPTYSGFSDPGNTLATALDTSSYIGGALTSTQSIFQDTIGGSDTVDLYKFLIGGSSASTVTLSLDGLTSNADLLLQNSSGQTLLTSFKSGTSSELITTTLNPGTYYARVYVSGSSVPTTNYNLSLSANTIPTDLAGNTPAAALDLGSFNTLSSPYSTIDFVSNVGAAQDTNDYYKFNLTETANLYLTLDGLGNNADVELLDSSATTVIASSKQSGTTPESITRNLSSGIYYIRVFPGVGSATNYNLNLVFDPPDYAGNSQALARNINTLTSTPSNFTDFVNNRDPNDYYRFDLSSSALINLNLTPATANADVQLLNSSGTVISSSSRTGTAIDSINRSLNAGTYYIRVFPSSGASTSYNLSVSATTIPPDQAPNTRLTARNIGTLNGSQSFNDFVGDIDTNDYYVFNLSKYSLLNVTLSGMSADADMQLLNSSGGIISYPWQDGPIDENLTINLNAGTYYIRVFQWSGNTFYNLSVSATPQPQILQISPGAGSSNPDNLTALGSTLYFTANDGTNGNQLWKSDGTGAGTQRLTTVNPSGFNPDNLTVFGSSKLFFTANDGTNGTELWVYNGTTAQMVSNINPGAGSSNPSNLTVVGSKLFFTANDGTNGTELWVYDDTTATVSFVKDIYSGATGSNPTRLTAFNGKLYFAATDATNGTELWSSNGTAAGTTLVKDIQIGGLSSSPGNLTVVGSSLYFTADDGTNGVELWKSDGTTAGTISLTNLNSALGPTYLTAVGTTLFFVTDSNGDFQQELWKSNGTAAGTVRVKSNLAVAPNIGFGPSNLAAVGNILYFTTPDSATGLELWRSDGTDTGTYLVKDIWTGADPNNSYPDSLVNFNGTLYFAASDANNRRELWSSNGTALGTSRVSTINATGNANPAQLTVVGNKLFFTATDGTNGTELWVF
ncbi:MAG: pre-peptidase C-terminal domain-containing protein [Fischerella sp.]|nr:pre-peptidase C-terminal domain-containing protein [Fischerella sp.]